jgi:predicted dehydrogenase
MPRARTRPHGPLGVGLIGTKFMGRAHSVAWSGAARFFDLPAIACACVAGRDPAETHEFGRRWGWTRSTADWRELVADPHVQLVDVAVPNNLHAPMSLAALAAGKHVACEKPLAGTLADARRMRDAARKAARRGIRTFVWFNYRRTPAVALMHRMVREGRVGHIRHVRATYLQDWGGPSTPMLWRFDAGAAGSGAHGDLNAHIVDMARFVTGEEVVEVNGAVERTFVASRVAAPARRGGRPRMARSTVDDCVAFLATMSGGAVATFEASRVATGHKNRNTLEVNGERGSMRFDFERMNELEWWDDTLPQPTRGWSRIMCTEPVHPYVHAYWPPAHLIGYEHGFVSQAADIARVLSGLEPEAPLADFEDAFATQCVLEAAIRSARTRKPVAVRTVARG